jgi:hypothetical protein
MTLRQLVFPEYIENFRDSFKSLSLLADGKRLRLTDPSGCLLLRQAIGLNKSCQTLGLLNKVKVTALQVFHKGNQAGINSINIQRDTGYGCKPCQLGCPQPPLSGDKLIARV